MQKFFPILTIIDVKFIFEFSINDEKCEKLLQIIVFFYYPKTLRGKFLLWLENNSWKFKENKENQKRKQGKPEKKTGKPTGKPETNIRGFYKKAVQETAYMC